MRLSSLDISTTNGMLLARIVPSFGMLICHTLSNSNNKASNAWSTLSNSSISRTQGFSYCNARNSGPALKNCWPCNSVRRHSQSMPSDLDLSSTESLCNAFIELADGLLFIDAFVTLQAFDRGSCRLGKCIRQLRFSATSWTF